MGKKAAVTTNDARRKMLAAVNIRWKQRRPDLRHDEEGLKEGLRSFAAQVCELANVESIGDLNNRELGRLLDALKEPSEMSRPMRRVKAGDNGVSCGMFGRGKSGDESVRPTTGSPHSKGEIVHLASEAQKITLQKLFEFAEWDAQKIQGFVSKRFRVKSFAMLRFHQANSLTRILLNIGVSKQIKKQVGKSVKVTEEMIRAGIPELKRKLGIDQAGTIKND